MSQGAANYNLTKIVIANQELLLLEQPIKIIERLYGVSSLLTNRMSQRFETYKKDPLTPLTIAFFFEQLCAFVPAPASFRFLYAYNVTWLEYVNSYRTYRHLFNLPANGQRTWGGGKSARANKSQLFDYKLKKLGKFFKTDSTLFAAEVVNLLWYQQWPHEWEVSRRYQKQLPWYVQKKKKWLATDVMAMRRIESFFKHPYRFKKKKHHRKKKKLNKHIITTGFQFGFSQHLNKNLNVIL